MFHQCQVAFYASVKDAVGYKTRSGKPLALVKWDAEFRCHDSYVLLDPELYVKEGKEGGWAVLGDQYVRCCDALRKARGDGWGRDRAEASTA